MGGRRRAELARQRLAESIAQIGDEVIMEPVEHVVSEHEKCRVALTALLR